MLLVSQSSSKIYRYAARRNEKVKMLKSLKIVRILIKHFLASMILMTDAIIAQEILFWIKTLIKKIKAVLGESHIDFRTQCVIMTETT